jgi:hypothetical protein
VFVCPLSSLYIGNRREDHRLPKKIRNYRPKGKEMLVDPRKDGITNIKFVELWRWNRQIAYTLE